MSRLLFFTLIFLLFRSQMMAQSLENEILKDYYLEKAWKYLIKDDTLGNYLSIDNFGIAIYTNPQKTGTPELAVAWSNLEQLKAKLNDISVEEALQQYLHNSLMLKDSGFVGSFDTHLPFQLGEFSKPLLGVRIAIDPGHIAGDIATGMLEQKFVRMKIDTQYLEVAEGMLTLEASLLLKEKLEAAGATIFMTRSKPNETSFGKTYPEWLQADLGTELEKDLKAGLIDGTLRYWLKYEASPKEIYHKYFKHKDFIKRAEMINTFHPNLTLVIHLNVDETNRNWEKPTPRNYNMCFIPGSFCSGELDRPLDRFYFMRLLLAEELEKSERLAGLVVNRFDALLNIKPLVDKKPDYLTIYSKEMDTIGVYSGTSCLNSL